MDKVRALLLRLDLVVFLILILALTVNSTLSASVHERIVIIDLKNSINPSTLEVCGVNYVFLPNDTIMLIPPASIQSELFNQLLSSYGKILRERVKLALEHLNISTRVITGVAGSGGNLTLYALLSVPSNISVDSLVQALEDTVNTVEVPANVDVVVYLQLIPPELYVSNDIDNIVKTLSDALTKAAFSKEADVISDPKLARLASALKSLGRVTSIVLGRGSSGAISIDLGVENANLTHENIETLLRAIRSIIGCEYPLEVGIAEGRIVQLNPITITNDHTEGQPSGRSLGLLVGVLASILVPATVTLHLLRGRIFS